VPERYAVWLDRDVIAAEGPQAQEYLQGQLSQDLLEVRAGGSALSWVLAPTGKVDALVRVSRASDDEWVLDTDAGWGDQLLDRLKRFKLRTKVDISPRSWRVLGLRGDGFQDEGFDGVGPELLRVDASWPGFPGVDLIGLSPALPPGWRLALADEYEADRVAAGVPRMGAELTDKTIPGETGLVDRTVSFTKGCYTGQELVARIDSRGGNVARHLRKLTMADNVEPGAELRRDDLPAGVVTSSAYSERTGWVGLGYVRRGFDPPLTLLAGADGTTVEVNVRA
jgi:folate-binding protein YgfZ